jgi:hypothetical protein
VVVPAAHLLGRPAPIAVAGVQHVVLEVLELVVRRACPFQVETGMPQKEALPEVGIGALKVAQRIERQLVMRAAGMGGIDDMEHEVHGAFPPGASATTVPQSV